MTRQLTQQAFDRESDQENASTASRFTPVSGNSTLQSLKHSVHGCFGRQPFFKVSANLYLASQIKCKQSSARTSTDSQSGVRILHYDSFAVAQGYLQIEVLL